MSDLQLWPIEVINGVPVRFVGLDGPRLSTEADARDLILAESQSTAEMIVQPASRLVDEFFHLSSGVAGAFVQRFANLRMRLAIVGDVSKWEAESQAFGDFVRKSNRRRDLWFVPDASALEEKLNAENR